jgi:hypothetical protein
MHTSVASKLYYSFHSLSLPNHYERELRPWPLISLKDLERHHLIEHL